ncbi:cyclic nucleotide-binding-like protein [Chytriomyces sp. MP71]|nr:cyclic nucleotide-binding-like protein [Chytriomyces sp. MP71]
MHIQYDLRCSDERGACTFLQNGLHPLSSFSAIASTFHIGVIFLAGFVELGKTSFYKDNLYMAWTNWIPESNAEQIVNLCFILVGAVLYALLVGLLSSAAISYDASGRLYQQKIDELMQYLTWKRIDEETKTRVLSYFEFKYRGKYFEEQSLLEDMNNSLRMELASINCRRLIEKVPFLHRQAGDGRDEIYLGKIATALKAAYYITGDYVFHQGDSATEMYFIQSGKVNIIVNSKLVSHANEGSFFGEVALIANIPRTASIQAAVPCVLYSLSANSFGEILNEFEDIKERVELIFQDRMEKVKKEKEGKVKALGIAKFL